MSSIFGNLGNKGGQPVANNPLGLMDTPAARGYASAANAGQITGGAPSVSELQRANTLAGFPMNTGINAGQGTQGGTQGPLLQSPSYDPAPYRQALSQFNVPSKGGAQIGEGDISSGLQASLSGGNVTGGGGWNSVTGTEFGEIDNPKYGGYTEPNWDKGAWGDDLTGWGNKGIALPNPNVPHGTVVEVMNPATGRSAYATVKDRGPGPKTGSGIDLLAGTRAELGLPKNSSYPIRYRIIGPAGTPIPGATGPGAQVALQQPTRPAAGQQQPTRPAAAGQQQRQPQKKQPQKQQKKAPPQIRRSRHIAYNTQNPPAELQFLRQSLGSMYQEPQAPEQQQSSEEA